MGIIVYPREFSTRPLVSRLLLRAETTHQVARANKYP